MGQQLLPDCSPRGRPMSMNLANTNSKHFYRKLTTHQSRTYPQIFEFRFVINKSHQLKCYTIATANPIKTAKDETAAVKPQVLTFLIDSSRFRYPERAIVFLAVCYLVVGCAYVAGLGAGDSVACREPFPPPVRLGRLQMMSTITQGHRQTTACTVLFMALYFCCMAAFAWWSCLAFAWFLAAGLKWGHEAIENKSHLFHLVAWAIPALQTISVLALAKVEGEYTAAEKINRNKLYMYTCICKYKNTMP
ncbi:unnamed protein product [Ceratitis capitata]|uniref:(Mediterranean fruit fly) hypothetical protein n=1 Tax=Ceratitis capitata TaxID=7213 RepID=A0A811V7S2_CERCA|nr:unnamed protein product [Ceratitis capitata]